MIYTVLCRTVLLASLLASTIAAGHSWATAPQSGAGSQAAIGSQSTADHLIVVIGAGGTEEYTREFTQWGTAWKTLADNNHWQLTMIDGQSVDASSRDQLHNAIGGHSDSTARLWIVLLGHGTTNGSSSKFNLTGEDVSSKELTAWIEPLGCPIVVVNCSSASAPFLPELSGPKRLVLTATRSGSEINYSRFGKHLALSLEDLSADIDHDLEVSLLEAFLAAAARTEQFYREDARLATEHALIDDNGDRRGTSSDFYRGLRPIKTGEKGEVVDGQRAARVILYSSPQAPHLSMDQTQQRTEIESQLDALRSQKSRFDEVEYFQQLEQLLLQLAAIYQAAEAN